GHEDDSARLLEAFLASSLVAMQPSDSLQENVRRTEVGEQVVRVEVQALLDRLGRHDDPPSIGPALAESSLEGVVECFAVLASKAGVMRRRLLEAPEEKARVALLREEALQGQLSGDAISHRVAKDENLGAPTSSIESHGSDGLGLADRRLDAKANGFRAHRREGAHQYPVGSMEDRWKRDLSGVG